MNIPYKFEYFNEKIKTILFPDIYSSSKLCIQVIHVKNKYTISAFLNIANFLVFAQ